jgi:hypothetical protein
MTKIYYNNNDVFNGIAPTPFISLSSNPINLSMKIGDVENITLVGQITGLCGDFQEKINKQNNLVNFFAENFKPLVVLEDSEVLYSGQCASVESINFEESAYDFSVIPFSISLKINAFDRWSFEHGVKSPVDLVSFSETSNGILEITRKISAVGFNTDTNSAFDNAKKWVLNRLPLPAISPAFCDYHTLSTSSIHSFSEDIDRLNGSYGVTQNYRLDAMSNQECILRYSVSLTHSEESGLNQVSIEGEVYGGIDEMQAVRDRFEALNIFNLANSSYVLMTGLNDLSTYPLSHEVKEIVSERKIQFSFAYNNDPSPLVTVKSVVSCTGDLESGSLSVNIKCDLSARSGKPSERYALCLARLNSLENGEAKGIAYSYFLKVNPTLLEGANPFLYIPNEKTIVHMETDGKISYSETWVFPDPTYSFSVSFAPSIQKYDYKRTLCHWSATAGAFENGNLSINGWVIGSDHVDRSVKILNNILASLDKIASNRLLKTSSSGYDISGKYVINREYVIMNLPSGTKVKK